MTLIPHTSHSSPSVKSKSFELFHISSHSLVYQKAKNVENGQTHLTHHYAPVRGIALTKSPL